VVVKPLQRPRDKWYDENFDEMCKYFIESVNKVKLENENIADAICQVTEVGTRYGTTNHGGRINFC
jgi:hypothetical protein